MMPAIRIMELTKTAMMMTIATLDIAKTRQKQHAAGDGRLRPRYRYLLNWTKRTRRF